MRSLPLGRIALAILVVAVVVIAVMWVLRTGDDGLVVSDRAGDCREPGRDWGQECDPGADVESVRVSRDGEAMVVEIELDESPDLGAGVEWTVQFNVASESGRVCGATNVTGEAGPGDVIEAYGFDPAFGLSELTRKELPIGTCRARWEGSALRFDVEMADQDPALTFRVAGSVRLEYPDDESRPGSEDDFGFEVALAEL